MSPACADRVDAPGARRRPDVPELAQALEITTTALATRPPPTDDPTLGPRVTPLELRALPRPAAAARRRAVRLSRGRQRAAAPESIRFFYLDRAWTDALVQGALSVGTVTTADRAQLEALYPHVRDEVDEAERRVRLPGGEERVQRRRRDRSAASCCARAPCRAGPACTCGPTARSSARPTTRTIPESDPGRMQGAAHGAPGARGAAGALRRRARPSCTSRSRARASSSACGSCRPDGPNRFDGREVPLRDASTAADVAPITTNSSTCRSAGTRPACIDIAALATTQLVTHQRRPTCGADGRRHRVRAPDAALPVPPGVRRPDDGPGTPPIELDVFRRPISVAAAAAVELPERCSPMSRRSSPRP